MRRRLVTPRFVANVLKALQPGGTFVVQTDNPDYWGYMTKLLPTMFDFQERAEPWPDASEGRSRREILARSRGLTIYRGLAVPRTDVTPEIANDLAGMLPMPTFRTHGPWCDLDEIEALSGNAPRQVLLESAGLSSHAYVILDRNQTPIAAFGAAPYPLPGVGVVWMLGTAGVDKEALAIGRATKATFEMLNEAYPMALWNYIDGRNKLSMRWLRWGGFKVLSTKPMGPDGLTFHLFARSSHV
jgi:hypothetical protein